MRMRIATFLLVSMVAAFQSIFGAEVGHIEILPFTEIDSTDQDVPPVFDLGKTVRLIALIKNDTPGTLFVDPRDAILHSCFSLREIKENVKISATVLATLEMPKNDGLRKIPAKKKTRIVLDLFDVYEPLFEIVPESDRLFLSGSYELIFEMPLYSPGNENESPAIMGSIQSAPFRFIIKPPKEEDWIRFNNVMRNEKATPEDRLENFAKIILIYPDQAEVAIEYAQTLKDDIYAQAVQTALVYLDRRKKAQFTIEESRKN